MVISQGHVYWADLPSPTGSGPGFRRPIVVVQGDALNRSSIRTVVCVPLTSNLVWVEAPGNVLLPAKTTGLPKDSVANTSQIIALDRDLLRLRRRLPLGGPRLRRALHRARGGSANASRATSTVNVSSAEIAARAFTALRGLALTCRSCCTRRAFRTRSTRRTRRA